MANAFTRYGQASSQTPQARPIPGREAEMVMNAAGGYAFEISDWQRLDRFVILSSEGGTYYTNERDFTEQNANSVIRCIKQDGRRVVDRVVELSHSGRAPKNDTALFCFALVYKHGDVSTKIYARGEVTKIVRTGYHLLQLVSMINALTGWGHSKVKTINQWILQPWLKTKSTNEVALEILESESIRDSSRADNLAFQVMKYKNRNDWAMRDVLRLTHPRTTDAGLKAVFDWTCLNTGSGRRRERSIDMENLPQILRDHDEMRTISDPVSAALWGIDNKLPREALPTEALTDRRVWEAMLPTMPLTACLRNIANMTRYGLFDDRDNVNLLRNKLTNSDHLKRSRIHPFAVCIAALTYNQGHGMRGKNTWIPLPSVIEILDDMYDLTFKNVEPTNKRICLAVDVSGSMTHPVLESPISCAVAARAMALTIKRVEPYAVVVDFDTCVRRILPITRRTPLSSTFSYHPNGGGTDLSAGVRWASGNNDAHTYYGFGYGNTRAPAVNSDFMDYDVFVILSDNETWAGHIHCSQALENYRKMVDHPVRLVCCAFASNKVDVVDPIDRLQLGVAGLDGNLVSLVNDFIK